MPLLGFVAVPERTQAQHDAHAAAAAMIRTVAHYGLRAESLPKGSRIVLTDLWKHPDVVADLGRPFIRELQNTGSCVKVGGSNALRCTLAAQRVADDNPTQAFEPFTWHNYAMSRHYMGDDGRGEGSMGSTFYKSLTDDGVIAWVQDASDNLPDYRQSGAHISITAAEEIAWSSYHNLEVQRVLQKSRERRLKGGAAEAKTPQDIRALVQNGYGVSFACNNYIGDASVRGSGDKARVMGRWNGRGGHQQWILGFEEHPDFGPIYGTGNNWPDDTYPRDPGGLPLCCCWVAESNVEAAMRLDSEVYGLAHQDWFPARPRLLNWIP